MSYEICEECGHNPVQCHAAFDRVRELEAEVARCYEMETFERKRAEKAEARVAELEGVYEAEACPTCGVTQVALWETHQSIHKAREREAE